MRRRGRRNSPGQLRLWPIGWALAACFAAASAGLAGLTWLALVLLHHPNLPRSSTVSLHDLVGVLQLVFASVAGSGALVALVMGYRRQRVAEVSSAHDRTRMLNERFTAIATQLGDDQNAVRLAGVHALAGLADDWEENLQTCIDVLCAYLRLPYEPDPGQDADTGDRLAYRASREARHTIIRIVADHLRREESRTFWIGHDFNFTGVVFDGGDFSNTEFSIGLFDFNGACFSGGTMDFSRARFCGALVDFEGAEFAAGEVDFSDAEFSAGLGALVDFTKAKFAGALVDFTEATFSGAVDTTNIARLTSPVSFRGAEFSGSAVDFRGADMSRAPKFDWGGGTPPSGVTLPVEPGVSS